MRRARAPKGRPLRHRRPDGARVAGRAHGRKEGGGRLGAALAQGAHPRRAPAPLFTSLALPLRTGRQPLDRLEIATTRLAEHPDPRSTPAERADPRIRLHGEDPPKRYSVATEAYGYRSPLSPTTKIALTGQLPAAVSTSSSGAPSGSTTTAFSSSSSWNTSGGVSTQSPEPMHSDRSTVTSIRFCWESSGTSGTAAQQQERHERGQEHKRDQGARVGAAALAVRLGAGGHRELLGRQHVVGLLDAGRVGREALVARADAELVGGQHVVRLLDPARVGGRPGLPGFSLGHRPYRSRSMEAYTRTELEAAAFRRLVQHLRERTDVQNIDLMELAGFCRNCLSRWYREAAEERGIDLPDAEAREIVYGMPYEEWKSRHQSEPQRPPAG